MPSTETDTPGGDGETLARVVDWGVSALLALAGVLLGALGWFLYLPTGRPSPGWSPTAPSGPTD